MAGKKRGDARRRQPKRKSANQGEPKAQILDSAIRKMLKGGPEQERVAGPLVALLLEKGYSLEHIRFGKKEWRVPKSPAEAAKREKGHRYEGFPVDIAIFDPGPDRRSAPRIIIETKRPEEEAGVEQLKTYLGLEPEAKLGVWTNSSDPDGLAVFVYEGGRTVRKKPLRDIPPPGAPIKPEEEPLRYRDLVSPEPDTLRKLFEYLMNRIASEDSFVSRPEERLNELCNLILLKLESDRKARALGKDAEVEWRVYDSPEATARMIRERFREFTRIYDDVFPEEEDRVLRSSDRTIHTVVEALQGYRLIGAKSEAVSQAFQVLRTKALLSADGQFFTPQEVIEAGVALVGVGWDDLIVDPASGTGGFLMEAFLSLKKQVTEPEDAVRWAQAHLYGVDKDRIAVKLAKAVMQIGGDGSANIYRGDSIRPHIWPKLFPLLEEKIKRGRFSLVLTNPPFGKDLKVTAEDLEKSRFTIHSVGGKERGAVPIGLAFLELARRLLKPGGKVGIVLPETYFFSRSHRWVMEWLRTPLVEEGASGVQVTTYFKPVAVANIPMEAFQKYARAKTNFYVFEKTEQKPDYKKENVLFLNPRTCGITPDGRHTEDNELRDHVEAVREGELPEGARRVALEDVYASGVLVPRFYDPRYEKPLDRLLKKNGLAGVSLGELLKRGFLEHRFGHGSPGRLDRSGSVPYIKVSDLRAGRVNVNPTNLVPRDIAENFWKGKKSGLEAWDLLTPIRASSNIGEFAVLLPGEEDRVLTKEILVLRATEEGMKHGYTPSYLFWALSLGQVREGWRRVTLMQTNREDLGELWKKVRIPAPKSPKWAEKVSAPIKEYFEALAKAKKVLEKLSEQEKEGFSFVSFLGLPGRNRKGATGEVGPKTDGEPEK